MSQQTAWASCAIGRLCGHSCGSSTFGRGCILLLICVSAGRSRGRRRGRQGAAPFHWLGVLGSPLKRNPLPPICWLPHTPLVARPLIFLHEWRRRVCRSRTSHLSRVKKELLDRLRKTRKDQSNPTPTKQQHNKTQEECNLKRSSESQEGTKKVRQGR